VTRLRPLALAVLLAATRAAATPLGPVVADFTETLDLNPTHLGPRVLQDLDADASLAPDLADDEELSNPSEYAGSLVVDLAPDTGLLTLTPSAENCWATIDVELANLELAAEQAVTGIAARSLRAFVPSDEKSPALVRTVRFTADSLRLFHSELILGERCPLDPSPARTPDVWEVNPEPIAHDRLAGTTFDLRETLDVGAGAPVNPRVLAASDVPVAAGDELDEADETANPDHFLGALALDLDPATGRLTVRPTDPERCYGTIAIELTDFRPARPGEELLGVALVETGAFDDEGGEAFARTVQFTERRVRIDYADATCGLVLGTGADVYQLFVPEPGAIASGVAAVAALGARRRRR
jgi:hypothetical protein